MTEYAKSHYYETAITKLRSCKHGEHGAFNQDMLNLMYKERDEVFVKHLTHKKLLATVKKNLTSALKFAAKNKTNSTIKMELENYIDAVFEAATSDAFLAICSDISMSLNKIPNSDSM
jgi:hypothetical protein